VIRDSKQTLPEDPALDAWVDPIRREILAGRSVFVMSAGPLLGRVREAVSAAGRPDDLRVIHVWPSEEMAFTPASRRVDPERLPPPPTAEEERILLAAAGEEGDVVLDLHKAIANLAIADIGLACLPALCMEDALAPGRAVVVVGGTDKMVEAYATWLHGLALDRAGPSDGPILAYDRAGWRPGRGIVRGLDGAAMRFVCNGGVRTGFVGRGCDLDRAFSAVDGDADAWRDALARFDARTPLVKDEGHVRITEGGRTVLARCVGQDERTTVGMGMVEAFEIGPGHVCRGVFFEELSTSRERLARLARLAWRGGLERIVDNDDVLIEDRRLTINAPGKALMRQVAPVDEPSVRRFVKAIISEELAKALEGSPRREAYVRIVSEDPAPPRRFDFCVAWPGFVEMLTDRDSLAWIDAGTSTVPLIASTLGVGRGLARRLVGVKNLPKACVEPPDGGNLYKAMGWHLVAFGPDRLPRAGDLDEWTAFRRLSLCMSYILDRCGTRVQDPARMRRLLWGIPGGSWAERCDRAGTSYGRGAVEMRDAAGALAAWLSDLAGVPVDTRAAFDLLAERGSLADLALFSNTWHRTPDLGGNTSGLPDDCAWPVPFGRVDLGDGWIAVALESVRELVDEGRDGPDAAGMPGLAHCVGSYGKTCQEGSSIVVSLRHDAGQGLRRVSTLELVPDATGVGWRIGGKAYRLNQHRGRRNADPPSMAKSRMSKLCVLIAEDLVPIDRSALEPRAPETRERVGIQPELLHGAWRRILPDHLARLGLEDLVAAALAARGA
jgi:hypothetical protein